MNNFMKNFFINRNFAYMWLGAIIVSFGFQMYSFALPIIIYNLTESAFAMSIMKAFNALPIFLLGIISGEFIDRYNKKNIMLTVLVFEIILLLLILLCDPFFNMNIWLFYLLAFSLSSCSYIFSVAKTSLLPILVEKQDLLRANAKSTFTTTLVSIIGPSIAGSLLILFNYRFNFTIFMISLIILLFFIKSTIIPIHSLKISIDENKNKNKNKKKILSLKSVFEVLTDTQFDKKLIYIMAIIVFSNSLVNGILIYFAYDYVHISTLNLGLIFSFSGVGGMLSSLFIGKLKVWIGSTNLISFSIVLNLVGSIILIFSSTWWLIGVSMFIRTSGLSLLSIYFISYRQEHTPINTMGKVASAYNMVIKGIPIIGTLIAGIWGEFLGVHFLFGFSSLLVVFALFKHLKN